MLLEIFVKNLALIEEMRLTLHEGMNVVTGETGAGKSLFVHSILLLQGLRASSDLISFSAKEAIVEGVFGVTKTLKQKMDQLGLSGDEVIIRRHLTKDGRNRIFINGISLSLGELRTLTQDLLEVTGQHESQKLLDASSQQGLFDTYCFQGQKKLLFEKYENLYQKFKALKSSIEKEEEKLKSKEREESIIRFQLDEIESAKIKNETEEDDLLQMKATVKNRDALQKLCDFVFQTVNGHSDSILSSLTSLQTRVEKLGAIDEELLQGSKLVQEAQIPLNELISFFKKYESRIPSAHITIDQMESRLFELQTLRRKYGPEIKDVIARKDNLTRELTNWQNSDERLLAMKKEYAALESELLPVANEMSALRTKTALELKKKIEKELKDLAMPHGEFVIRVSKPAKPMVSDLSASGYDKMAFEMSANRGEPPKELSKIASGGELSRLMLAIKKVFFLEEDLFCVFDEIDTGIGGEIAHVVGEKLKEISQKSQTLVVTHLPQIAARADHHFKIEKNVIEGKTKTSVTYLETDADREAEIARMVGGNLAPQKSRALAKEMLQLG